MSRPKSGLVSRQGGALSEGTYVFDGRIDEVALYKRVLNAAERTWLHNDGRARTYADLNSSTSGLPTSYTYADPDHIHAVTSLSTGETYEYDENGNMTCRAEAGETFIQTYNAENRIASIQKLTSGTCAGGSHRQMGLYLRWRRRSYGASLHHLRRKRIARNAHPGALLFWRRSRDHRQFGEEILFLLPRTMPPYASVTSTDFTYTGQSDMSGTGLMDYKARLYSPCIMHFVQPDTLIPDIYNPQDWNRYSYARNNPLKYTDPTGHRICGIEDNNCEKIIVLERIKIQIDKEFDPFTGPLPDDFEYDDSKISEADMLIKKLYFDHSINWHELARNLESNTVTIELLLEWVDAEAPWYLIYGRVFRINANHVPYALFLAELGLPTDTDPHFMNYESNYLAALMANHARELERAKQVYLTQYALRDDYQLWLELFGEGAPWSTGD